MSSARTSTARRPGETDRPDRTGSTRADGGSRRPGLLGRVAEGFADLRLVVSQAVGAVALGLVVCVGLVVLGWASDPAAATPWPQAVRVGVALWLLAHLGDVAVLSEVATSPSPADPLTTVQGLVTLPPLLLTLAAAWPAWRAGQRLASRGGPVRAGVLLLPLAATYAGVGWLLAWATDTAVLTPAPTACAVGAAALALLGATPAVLRRHGPALLERLPRHVEVQVRRTVPAAGVALTAWLLGGAVLLTAGLLLHLPTVADVHATVTQGVGGGTLLLLLQVAFLPAAAVWGASVLAGPGVWLGGSHVGPGGSTVVDVPAVPLLAALPSPGAFPLWAFLAPLAVVAAGALAAWHAHRDPSSRGATLADRAADAVAVAALTGLGALVLGWLASGALGPWQPLGPDPLLLAGVIVVEVFVGALLAGSALHLLTGRPLGRWATLSGRVRRDRGDGSVTPGAGTTSRRSGSSLLRRPGFSRREG